MEMVVSSKTVLGVRQTRTTHNKTRPDTNSTRFKKTDINGVVTSAPASEKVNNTFTAVRVLWLRNALAPLVKKNMVARTTVVAHTMRMAVASVGNMARRRMQAPSGNSDNENPTWTSMGWCRGVQ